MTAEIMEPGDFITSYCTKCKKMTKHILVGLVEGVPTKVQCTICKGNHLYRKEAAGTPASRKRAARTHVDQDWLSSSGKWDESQMIPYSMSGVFKKGDLVSHTVFGLGLVRTVSAPKRMHVLFEHGQKLMVCGN